MLPRRYRLRREIDVRRVRRHGQSWRHPLAILLVVPAGNKMIPLPQVAEQEIPRLSRFAFSASQRAGSAVARNRAKRLLREAVRAHLDHIEPGWDCLLIARQRTTTANYVEVQTAVNELLTRAHLLSYSVCRQGSLRN
jgi:ribonuclease P protein component